MTKMKSFRMQPTTIKMIKFLCEKTEYSEAELIKEAIFELLQKQIHYNNKTKKWNKWNKNELEKQTNTKAANHLDKSSDQY